MLSVTFSYYLNDVKKYTIVASCKNVVGNSIDGFKFRFINDQDETVRMKYDKELFEDIETEATEMLVEEYYSPAVNVH